MENTKIKTLTKEQKDSISNYLESRLGQFGVHSYSFKWSIHERSGIESATHEINLNHCGVLKHMLKSCELNLRVWGPKDKQNKTIEVGFSYSHHDGGSNGHDTNINLRVSSDAKVFEMD